MKALVKGVLAAGGALAAARALLTTVTVRGASMEPSMRSGEVWLALRWGRPRVGRVVSASAPEGPGTPATLVKRIAAVNTAHHPTVVRVSGATVRLPARSAWLLGDNAAVSMDSRELGPFPLASLRRYPVLRLSA